MGGEAPGGRGGGRAGIISEGCAEDPWGVYGLDPGVLRGIGGGALGFSKLLSWFEGKRGLAGGLETADNGAFDMILGIRSVSPEIAGSLARA